MDGPVARKVAVDCADSARIRALLGYLSHKLAAELRDRQALAGGVKISIAYANGFCAQRSVRLSAAAGGATLARAIVNLYESGFPNKDSVQRIHVRALGVREALAENATPALEMVAAGA